MDETNDLVIRALETAAKAHQGDNRKGTDTPYIVHPVETAMILERNGMTKEVITAGLLHDLLEDTEVNKEYILDNFGDEISKLVVGASEKLKNREQKSWDNRKSETVNYLKEKAPFKIKCIACADKLSNAKSMLRELKTEDQATFWDKFNAEREKQKWYYESLVESLKDLEGLKMYEELKNTVDQIFNY